MAMAIMQLTFLKGKIMNQIIKNEKCAISMIEFGITTAILTSKSGIDEILHELINSPDEKWCDGRGKAYLHGLLKRELIEEDQFFNRYPKLVSRSNQRWVNFCDDCLLLYVLDAYLFEKPFLLIHPASYEYGIQSALAIATDGSKPDLINGIPVLQ